jgi:putative membrane protein
MSAQGAQRDKTLILCIDNDNDIGTKASVQTPVIGKEANVEAATRLALQDPEEADANAIFAAVKMLNTLQSNDSQAMYEVATVCGSENGGVEADRKIIRELNNVLDRFPARGVIFVSDGYSDQEIKKILGENFLRVFEKVVG